MQTRDDKQEWAMVEGGPRLYVRARRLAEMLDVSPATIWRWVSQKRLPAPRKLGPGVTGFDLREVRAALKRAPRS